MDTENKTESSSQHGQKVQSMKAKDEKITSKPSRKKKIIIIAILVIASAYGVYSYVNNSPDPTTWESLRGDYKNTK